MIDYKKIIKNLLFENVGNAPNVFSHILALGELLSALKPSSIRDKKILDAVYMHIKEIRKLSKKSDEMVPHLLLKI